MDLLSIKTDVLLKIFETTKPVTLRYGASCMAMLIHYLSIFYTIVYISMLKSLFGKLPIFIGHFGRNEHGSKFVYVTA